MRLVTLLQGLLLTAHCVLGAGGPQRRVDEEPSERPQHARWDHASVHAALGMGNRHARPHGQGPHVSGGIHPSLEHGYGDGRHEQPSLSLPEGTVDASAEAGSPGTPARMGNWCAFVHKRMVTVAVSCGTEKYTIKSHSPCPNGTPNCQLVMYKLATRPVYREKQKIYTALLWRCCPGHGGKNCEELVADSRDSKDEDSGRFDPGGSELLRTGPETLTNNQDSEQNDHQDASSPVYETQSPNQNQREEHVYDYLGSLHEHHYERGDPHPGHEEHRAALPEATDPHSVLLPVLRDIMMSHLQPALDSFNQTLERLSEEMRDLQRDVAQLRLHHGTEMELDVLEGGEGGGGHGLQDHEDKLTESFRQLADLRVELTLQQDEVEQKLHAQHVMLQYNLTNFKTDVDVKLKRSQKTLQTNLLSLNSSLLEVKQEQEWLKTELESIWTHARMPPSQEEPHENTAVWEAIARLNNKVVNDTETLNALNEGQARMSKHINHLQRAWKTLDDRIDKTDRKSEDRYIEAYLEVDGAKEAVQKNVHDLATNITTFQEMLRDMEEDVDYLFQGLYKNISSSSGYCDCKALGTSVAQLKKDLANVTMLANENRLALDSAAEERLESWENGGWGPSVDDLKLGLLNLQTLLAFEQSKSRTLQQNVTALHTALLGNQMDIETLQELDRMKAASIKKVFSSFDSLVSDVLRHTDILRILLGEEVLEFMDWSSRDQEAYSLPALKESIRDIQEQINVHSRSLASMLNSAPPDTAGDEPLERAGWTSAGLKSGQGDQKSEASSKEASDYTDANVFVLEKEIEKLRAQIARLEEQQCVSCCNSTKSAAPRGVEAKLQTELTTVHKSLEEHLRIFSSLFSNTEGLLGSEATLDLDSLSSLMKKNEAKQQRKKEKKRTDVRRERHWEHADLRSKRDAALETTAFSQLPDGPFVFLASSQDVFDTPGPVVFETASLNRGDMYSPKTGTFRAPSSGVYLFVLTLDFGPGPSLARLKRGEEVAASLHQGQRRLAGPATRVCLLQLEQGEELQVEMVQGTLEHSNPQDNSFAGLLLLQTT
ncbi:multimerin-2a [Brachyhypopomus gauderio]|uniref:multimerin-2a n=1 Tax=Brachyhypopomus gauderio TaxID=698409 RepID=UPI004042A3D6